MCLVGLQDFYFDLGYEARLHMRLNNSARIIHYFVVVGLLFRCPTTCYKGIQLQESLEKDVVTQRGIGACTPTPRRWYDGLQARNSSKLSFADVFALILCWIPSSIIFILTRFNFTETMFNSYAISLWISQIPSPHLRRNRSLVQKRISVNYLSTKRGENWGYSTGIHGGCNTKIEYVSPGSETVPWVRRFWVS